MGINIDGATVERDSLIAQLKEQGFTASIERSYGLVETGRRIDRSTFVMTVEKDGSGTYRMTIGDPDYVEDEQFDNNCSILDKERTNELVKELQKIQYEMGW